MEFYGEDEKLHGPVEELRITSVVQVRVSYNRDVKFDRHLRSRKSTSRTSKMTTFLARQSLLQFIKYASMLPLGVESKRTSLDDGDESRARRASPCTKLERCVDRYLGLTATRFFLKRDEKVVLHS